MTRRQRLLIAAGETPRLTAQVQSSVAGDMITFMDIFVTLRNALSVGAPVAEVPKQ